VPRVIRREVHDAWFRVLAKLCGHRLIMERRLVSRVGIDPVRRARRAEPTWLRITRPARAKRELVTQAFASWNQDGRLAATPRWAPRCCMTVRQKSRKLKNENPVHRPLGAIAS
jgi:hypothetical protein